ncbi:hypothetical protein MRX96_014274 [Rhipicephalus microplus]
MGGAEDPSRGCIVRTQPRPGGPRWPTFTWSPPFVRHAAAVGYTATRFWPLLCRLSGWLRRKAMRTKVAPERQAPDGKHCRDRPSFVRRRETGYGANDDAKTDGQ